MYRTDEELFLEAVTAQGLGDHKDLLRITAAAMALIARQDTSLARMSEEQILVLCIQYGFQFESHELVRSVWHLCLDFLERRNQFRETLAKIFVQPFTAAFYHDPDGPLMARFTLGDVEFDPIVLTEPWETIFVHVYHYALQEALRNGLGRKR